MKSILLHRLGAAAGCLRFRPCLAGLVFISLLLPLLFLGPQLVYGQDTPGEVAESTLFVGVYSDPPFAIKTDTGWDGLAVETWNAIAREEDLDYELVEIEREDLVDGLQTGRLDLSISAVATPQEEQQIDFSHTFFTTSLGLAEPAEATIVDAFGALFSPRLIRVTLWLALLLAIVGGLVWLFERRANAEQFGGSALRGLWSGFWWAGVTVSTIGYGDKTPRTVGGRVVALLWMLVAIGITASLTATLTSILTRESGPFSTSFRDLRTMEVGAISDSGSAAYLESQRIQFAEYDSTLEGLQAVDDGAIEIFVDDSASLSYVNTEQMGSGLQVQITGRVFQYHVFAFPPDSELKEQVNRALLVLTTSGSWQDLIERYLPDYFVS